MIDLIEKNLVSKPSDIYLLNASDLQNLEGFKEKSIENLLNAIENSKKCSFEKFIMALQIKHIGKETAYILANEFKTIDRLKKVTLSDLLSIEGIGDKVATSIIEYFEDKNNIKEIDLLLFRGIEIEKVKESKFESHLFNGKIFVITGTLKNFSREEAKNLIKERKGKTSSSISKNTDYLLIGENPGSKLDKAKKLNVEILLEDDFLKML